MKKRQQQGIAPRLDQGAEFNNSALAGNVLARYALNTFTMTHIPPASLLELGETERFDLALKEIECARAFNFDLPNDLSLAVEMLENSIRQVTKTRKQVILLLNEETGTYTCLNDQKNLEAKPREITKISDHFLQDLLDAEEVIHTFLYTRDILVGIVAVADKADDRPFDVRDEITLELAARYLATKALSFQILKQSLSLPYIQGILLEISSQLIVAVDEASVMEVMLKAFRSRLGFDACQYVALDYDTGAGCVMFEAQGNTIRSFQHIGLKNQRRVIKDFASMVSLFTSMAWKNEYLHISGSMLGDKPLSELFNIRGIESALLLPVVNPATGKLQGTFNLFMTRKGHIAEQTIEIAKEAGLMVSMALSRATVLEKALAMANTDELTGITNRRGFYERFEVEIERARRNPTSLCVVMLDVDFFKKFNDTYGHLSGDIILRSLAATLEKNVRKSDLVSRFGGEEFALILPDTTLASATELLERIRKKIERMTVRGANGEPLQITISAGVAQADVTHGLSRPTPEVISEALALADQQLYLAKESGRNKICATCF